MASLSSRELASLVIDDVSTLLEQTGSSPAEADKQLGGRERILAVARAAFIERGFADVSMQELATAAGLTKAAIYYHFADKETLFEQVVVGEIDRLSTGVEAQIAQGPPLRDQIERVARFAFESGRGDFGRLLDDAHRYCAQDRHWLIRGQFSRPYAVIRTAFEAARERGEIRDVDIGLTINLFFSMVGSQMKGAGLGPAQPLTPAALAAKVADMVMYGVSSSARRPG